MISYKVFMSFVDEDGNAAKMQSKECYETWVKTRKSPPKKPQESFRRVLTAHACGVDGRRPFPEHIERSLLKVLRRKEVWDCFRGTGVSIGVRGFRNIGYHEKLRTEGKSKAKSRNETVTGKESNKTKRRLRISATAQNKKLKTHTPNQIHSNQVPAGLPSQAISLPQQFIPQINSYTTSLPMNYAQPGNTAYLQSALQLNAQNSLQNFMNVSNPNNPMFGVYQTQPAYAMMAQATWPKGAPQVVLPGQTYILPVGAEKYNLSN